MHVLLIAYYAILYRARGFSWGDYVTRRGHTINGMDKVIDFLLSKYACAGYMAMPYILWHGAPAFLAVWAGLSALFAMGLSPAFYAVHGGNRALGAGQHRTVVPISNIVDAFLNYKTRPYLYGIVFGGLRMAIYSLPLCAALSYFYGYTVWLPCVILLLSGVAYWTAGRINIKWAIPIAEVMIGALLGVGMPL